MFSVDLHLYLGEKKKDQQTIQIKLLFFLQIEIKENNNLDLNNINIIKSDENIELNSDDDILKESSIINSNINGLNQIKKWIKEKTNKHNINFKLIFKMSEHGYEGEAFHRYCDNEEPTLILKIKE